jgi:hypothetical protein
MIKWRREEAAAVRLDVTKPVVVPPWDGAEFDVDGAPVFLRVAMVLLCSSGVRARWRCGSRRQQGRAGAWRH